MRTNGVSTTRSVSSLTFRRTVCCQSTCQGRVHASGETGGGGGGTGVRVNVERECATGMVDGYVPTTCGIPSVRSTRYEFGTTHGSRERRNCRSAQGVRYGSMETKGRLVSAVSRESKRDMGRTRFCVRTPERCSLLAAYRTTGTTGTVRMALPFVPGPPRKCSGPHYLRALVNSCER
jgi:hypothetical protein